MAATIAADDAFFAVLAGVTTAGVAERAADQHGRAAQPSPDDTAPAQEPQEDLIMSGAPAVDIILLSSQLPMLLPNVPAHMGRPTPENAFAQQAETQVDIAATSATEVGRTSVVPPQPIILGSEQTDLPAPVSHAATAGAPVMLLAGDMASAPLIGGFAGVAQASDPHAAAGGLASAIAPSARQDSAQIPAPVANGPHRDGVAMGIPAGQTVVQMAMPAEQRSAPLPSVAGTGPQAETSGSAPLSSATDTAISDVSGAASVPADGPLARVTLHKQPGAPQDMAQLGFQMRLDAMSTAIATDQQGAGPNVQAGAGSQAAPVLAQGPKPATAHAASDVLTEPNSINAATDTGDLSQTTAAVQFAEPARPPGHTVAPSRADSAALLNTVPVSLGALAATVAAAARVHHAQPIGLQLDPIELGTVAFNMATGPDGLVVTINAERPETLELLRRNADQFLADLRQSGFQGATLQFSQSGNGHLGRGHSDTGQNAQPQSNGQSGSDHAALSPLFETQSHTPRPMQAGGLNLRL